MSEEEKILFLLKRMRDTNGYNRSANTEDLTRFFNYKLPVEEIEELCLKMIERNFVTKSSTKDGIAITLDDKSKMAIHELEARIRNNQPSLLSLNSSSNTLTTPSKTKTPKKNRTSKWGIAGWIWRIVVGIGVIIGIIVGIAQLNEWGYFEPLKSLF